MPSLINLRRRISEAGGKLGPPIVKGGTPREARREKRTLKQVGPDGNPSLRRGPLSGGTTRHPRSGGRVGSLYSGGGATVKASGVSDLARVGTGGGNARTPESELVEVRFDGVGERAELCQSRVEHVMQDPEIDLEVAVDEDVAESGHASEALGEVAIEDAELGERIDCGGVVRDITTSAGREVGRDVQRVLGAELKPAFDDPELVPVVQGSNRFAGVAIELLCRPPEGEKVAADNSRIGRTRSHGSVTFDGEVVREAASILSS